MDYQKTENIELKRDVTVNPINFLPEKIHVEITPIISTLNIV
jgi:hypothetical protein